jgi:hypothetical protein
MRWTYQSNRIINEHVYKITYPLNNFVEHDLPLGCWRKVLEGKMTIGSESPLWEIHLEIQSTVANVMDFSILMEFYRQFEILLGC